MDPCQMNTLVLAITNYLFANLSEDDFVFLSVLFNELAKSMFGTSVFKGICDKRRRRGEPGFPLSLNIDED